MPVKQRSQVEIDYMVKRFNEGTTLEEIGSEHGISRARVQQILSKAGIKSKDGGASKRAQIRAVEVGKRRLSMDEDRAKKYGLTLDEFQKLKEQNGNGIYMNDPESLFYGYTLFKRNQMRHYPGVEFKLTFPEWLSLWNESPLERNKSNWMVRKNPDKPFTKGNMKIVTASSVIKELRAKEARERAARAA